MSNQNKLKTFTKGLLIENPLLVLSIGLCSSLGVTTSVFNGFGMGISMTFVLLMSEIVISIFKKLIPQAIRLPVFIIIIAAFTTIVQMVLQAYVPALYSALGVFLYNFSHNILHRILFHEKLHLLYILQLLFDFCL